VVEALETTVGRPRKYGSEKTEAVPARVPVSVALWLKGGVETASASGPAADTLVFAKELDDELQDVHRELLMSAAVAGVSYDSAKAETLGRLVKLGLKAEKASRR
jgi:hypothetical protein